MSEGIQEETSTSKRSSVGPIDRELEESNFASVVRKGRSNSADGTLVEVKPMLVTGWFDTNDEFEAHRRVLKNRMHISVKSDGRYLDDERRKLY